MYKHYNECLFDSVIIIRESDKAASDFESVRLFGVNYEEKSKEIYRGVIDCFKIIGIIISIMLFNLYFGIITFGIAIFLFWLILFVKKLKSFDTSP